MRPKTNRKGEEHHAAETSSRGIIVDLSSGLEYCAAQLEFSQPSGRITCRNMQMSELGGIFLATLWSAWPISTVVRISTRPTQSGDRELSEK